MTYPRDFIEQIALVLGVKIPGRDSAQYQEWAKLIELAFHGLVDDAEEVVGDILDRADELGKRSTILRSESSWGGRAK